MEYICIDDDDDYANDLRCARRRQREVSALIKIEQEQSLDDERSERRLRRHSAKFKYPQCSRNWKNKKQEADATYASFLNFYTSKDEDQVLDFPGTDCIVDADPQYEKFLSFLKPCKNSYVLDLVEGDGTPNFLTYEDDNMTMSDQHQPKHNTSKNVTSDQENSDGMLHHISGNVLDIRNRNGFKFSNEPSEVFGGRSVTRDKMGEENARQPCLEESLLVAQEFTSFKQSNIDSQKGSFDVSYKFFLTQKLNLKDREKLSYPQNSKKRNIWSVAENATKGMSRKHTVGSKVYTGNKFDDSQGKKPRLSQCYGKGVNTTMDAKDIQGTKGMPDSRKANRLMQKMENNHEGKTSNCRNLRNIRQNASPDKAIQKDSGVQAPDDKQRKHILSGDCETSGKRSAASKVDQEANGKAFSLRKTLDGKLGNYHRLSGHSEQGTERSLADTAAEDAKCLHALHDNQSSGNKSCPKNLNQTRYELKVEGHINESYKAFLSGLSFKDGHLVFQSVGGKVVTYDKDLTSESDSDSVIILGDTVNGITDSKYCSTMPKKSCPQNPKLDKGRTSKDSSFKKKLLKILLKPYDQEEYESLMEIARKRKPLEGYRDLRSLRAERKGTYEMQILGKSYLDHHKDVVEAIKKCGGDRQKVLFILRGFIYWLEHVAHPEAFKPWLYKQYLGGSTTDVKHSKGHKSRIDVM